MAGRCDCHLLTPPHYPLLPPLLTLSSPLSSSSLASLIRGQVLTTDGTPLVGVNVSFVNYPHYGYTLTRQDGMYVHSSRTAPCNYLTTLAHIRLG